MNKILLALLFIGSLASAKDISDVKKCHDHILTNVIGVGFGYVQGDFVFIPSIDDPKNFLLTNGKINYACSLPQSVKDGLEIVINDSLKGFAKNYIIEKNLNRKTWSLNKLEKATAGAKPPAANCVDLEKPASEIHSALAERPLKWLTTEQAAQLYISRTVTLINELKLYYNDRKTELLNNYDLTGARAPMKKERSLENNQVFTNALNLCAQSPELADDVNRAAKKINFVEISAKKNDKTYKYENVITPLKSWVRSAPTKGQSDAAPSLPTTPKQ